MKIFFMLVLLLFQGFSLLAHMGARLRNTVYSMDLTQPAADQLKIFESKKFKKLKSAYCYLPELAVYPNGSKNFDQTNFGKNQTQEKLSEKYKSILEQAPKNLKLKCGGGCTYDHDQSDFSYVIKTRNKKAIFPLNFSIRKQDQLKAYAETEDGMLVLLFPDDTIEVYENFNRAMFENLSLPQLVILAHVYAISECIKGERCAFIHSSWYEIYATIDQKVFEFMFNGKINVAQLD